MPKNIIFICERVIGDGGIGVKEQISHTLALNNTDVLLRLRHSACFLLASAALIKTVKQKMRFVMNKLL